MLLLPFALFFWPIFVSGTSLLFSVLYSIFFMAFETVSNWKNSGIFYSGQKESYKFVYDYAKKFYFFNSNSIFSYLNEIRYSNSDQPYDISFSQLFMALFVSLHGILICTLSGALQGIVYLIPLTFTIIRVILKSYFKL
jgi:hypothetical protein